MDVPFFTPGNGAMVSSLRAQLVRSGFAKEVPPTFSRNCCRRDAGIDVLESEALSCHALVGPRWQASGGFGQRGMLRMGEWARKKSAFHYASDDEMDRVAMATVLISLIR